MQKIITRFLVPPFLVPSFLVLLTIGVSVTAFASEPEISILDGTKFTVGNTQIKRVENSDAVKIVLSDAGEVEKNRDHIVLKLKDGYRIMSQYQMDKNSPQKTIYMAVIAIDSHHKIANIKGTLTTAFPVALSLLNHEHPDIRALRLQHIMGSVDRENALTVTMQKTRDFGYVTYMKQGDSVASGGANLLYAGRYRFAEKGAKISIHSHGDFRHIYKNMGIAPELSDLERNTSPKTMYDLSHDEMVKYNVINVGSKGELEKFLNTKLP